MHFEEDDFTIHSGNLKSAEWLLDASSVMLEGAFSAPAPGEPMTMLRGPKEPPLDPVNDPSAKLNKQHYNYENMVNNVVSHYHGADDSQKQQGRLWYKAAHDFFNKLGADHGVSPAKAVAIGSAFSPQTDWDDNMRHAGHFMLNYDPNNPAHNEHNWQVSHVHPQALADFRNENGRDPSTSTEDLHHLADLHGGLSFKKGNDLSDPALRDQWIGNIQHHGMDTILADHARQVAANKKTGYRPTEVMRDILAPGAGGTLGKNVTRAKQIMRAGDDDPHEYTRILGGPKTQYFMSNILDDTPISEDGYYQHPNNDWTQHQDLGGTIDSHHLRASGMQHGDWVRKGYDEGASGLSPSNPQTYDVFNRGLLDATRRINASEPDPRKHLTPKQVQAVVWLKHKADNDRFKPMGINHESEAAQTRMAAIDPQSFHDMPPLWRKAFMSRSMPEWTDMLAAWVNHHSPTQPEGTVPPEHHQAATSWYTAQEFRDYANGGPMPGAPVVVSRDGTHQSLHDWVHTAGKPTGPQKCKYCKAPATQSILHSEGMAYIPVCDKHLDKGIDACERCTPDGSRDPSNIVKVVEIKQAAVDQWPGKTTRERRDIWQNLGQRNQEDADEHGFDRSPGFPQTVQASRWYVPEPRTAGSWYITADEESAGGNISPSGKKKDDDEPVNTTGIGGASTTPTATPVGVNNFDPSKVTAQPTMTAPTGGMLHYPTVPNVADGRLSDGAYGFSGASGGGSFGSGAPAAGGGAPMSSASPGGGAPSQNLTQALQRAGVDPSMYPLISGFSAAEGNNPSGAPTLGFTDGQAGSSLDQHAQALSKQLKDRSSVAGPFPHGGTPEQQASWMATVVGQNGSSSDWQGNAQPARSDYVNRIVKNMPGG
jgi:hypothetical protein